MSQQLSEVVERVASRVVLSDPEDLKGLAEVHTALQEIARLADESTSEPNAAGVAERATAAERMIESVILREIDDTTAVLAEVGRAVSDMLKLIEGVETSIPSPVFAPAAQSTAVAAAAADAHHDETPGAEPAISPDDVPLAQEFTAEANTHLETAEAELLKIESDPGDVNSVSAVFRSFHTIKGVAGFLNLKQVGALAHAAENLLDLARRGELRIEGATADLVLASVDLMKALIASLDAAAKSGTPIPAEPRLGALLERLRSCAANGGVVGAPEATKAVTTTTTTTTATPPTQAPTPATPLPREGADRIAAVPQPGEIAQAKPAASGANAGGNNASGDGTVKVATDRLDALINMVGELVIAQSMVAQDLKGVGSAAGSAAAIAAASTAAVNGQRLGRNMAHLGKLTRELQDLSMSMRMVPIAGVFQKMARVVRDLGRKSGKEIDFVVDGADTELDRNVVDAISDPLVHMVRNSCDHGIEQPEARVSAGKARAGRLQLRASHQAGQVVIDITDDGRGLNRGKIVKKAIAAGIVKEGEELTDQQIFQLIFHAGLSTAEKVTDVSGRGVGMDVVRKNVEALRGRIDIASTEGKGATFSIRLPLTLAVIDGLVIRVGKERYIVPITSIEQSLRPTAAQLSTVQGRGEICMVRERTLPLFRLHRMFNVEGAIEDPTQSLVVIVQDDDRRCCLLVDELLGQQQVVIKSLGDGIGQVKGVSGGAILGDGSVSLILDVPGLIGLASAS